MFLVQGELIVKPTPENLLGMFGFAPTEREQGTHVCAVYKKVGPVNCPFMIHREEDVVLRAFEQRKEFGTIPEGVEVERISTLQQAQKYVVSQRVRVEAVRLRRPLDIPSLMKKKIPVGTGTVEAAARLWEGRLRGVMYLASCVEFNPLDGWREVTEDIYGTRKYHTGNRGQGSFEEISNNVKYLFSDDCIGIRNVLDALKK